MRIFNAEEYIKTLESSTLCQTCEKVPLPHIGAEEDFIFISYAHRDYKKVYADLAIMYEAGVRFWYDKGLCAGKNWDEEVLEKLESPNCIGVIFYMSENLFASPSAFREIKMVHSLSRTEAQAARPPFNHFTVNLTNKLPRKILFDSIGCDGGRYPGMEEIGILAQVFPDVETYICFDHPEHKTELIHQIWERFAVVGQTTREYVSFPIDRRPSSVFITTLGERMDTPRRLRLIDDIRECLYDAGISSYVMQDNSGGTLHNELSDSLAEYVKWQNDTKLESAQHILIICCLLGWGLCAGPFGEFNQNVSTAKEVFYLIDDEPSQVECFRKFYRLEENDPVMQRVFFLSDYKERLPKVIRKNTATDA